MLEFGPCSSFAVLDLALGLVEHAAFIEPGIRAAPRCDLPDDLTIFMLFTLLDTGVSSVCINRVFFAVQQLGDLRDIGRIGRSAMDVMNLAGLYISANMGFRPEKYWLPFLVWCISGSRFPFSFLVEPGASTMVPWRSDRPFSCR